MGSDIVGDMKDTAIKKLMSAERARQRKVINLIASENYVSADVRAALASELVNKYAEGYPGRRYYGGNAIADDVERLAQERALKLFKLAPEEWAVNVQPLSGSPANIAALLALVPPGETIMGLSLDSGGHLTHGHKVSASGIIWKSVSYALDPKTERLNYDAIRALAIEHKPRVIIAGFTAYSRIIDWKAFRSIADACGAYLLVDMSHIAGLVAGGAYPSPFPYADVVTTTTHKTLRGPRSALIFSRRDKKGQTRDLPKKIDRAVFPGLQGGPHLNHIAAVAVALKEAQSSAFARYARQVVRNAQTLATELTRLGWRVVSGGTDSHLFLLDTWMGGSGIGGAEASARLEQAGIIVNKNSIPFDTRTPTDPSGIRLGTAAETTRGKKERDFKKIAAQIDRILRARA